MKILVITGTDDSDKLANYIRFFEDFPVEFVRYDRVSDFGKYDALFLIGGDDVNPQYYGEENLFPDINIIESERDRVEMGAIEEFERRNAPIFGICRGAQVINVYFGGSLWQDLPLQLGTRIHKGNKRGEDVFHGIFISRENTVFESGERLMVNSYHHQSIKVVGEGLGVFAYAQDGVVEGIVHEKKPILAVQWHPERLSHGEEAREAILNFLRETFLKS